MNFDQWKTALLDKHKGSGISFEYYWPKNDDFKKITKPFFKDDNGDVYSCKKMVLESAEEIENFIENSENLAVLDIVHHGKGSYLIRFIDPNQQSLTPITVEEFYEQNKQEMISVGTEIDDLKQKMEQATELKYIFIKRCVKKVNEMKIFIESVLTDGEHLYV